MILIKIGDEIRGRIKEASESAPVDDQTKENFNKALFELSKDVLQKVSSHEIEVEDIKDVKDLSAIFMNMQQNFNGADSTGAPQASAGVSLFFNDKLNAKKQPDQEDDEAIVDLDELSNLSEEELNEMIDKQGQAENADNVRKADELA